MRRLAFLLLAFSAFPGCTRPGTSSAPASSTSPFLSLSAPAPASPKFEQTSLDPLIPQVTPGAWQVALREHRWLDARTALDALPEVERSRPEIRLAQAKIARMLGDHRAVIQHTEGLQIPLVASLIARFRAEAALEVGPFEEAASYFVRQPGPRAALQAGLAWERAGKLDEARRHLDRAVAAARGEASTAAARVARARVLAALGRTQEAWEDAHWVVLHTPQMGQEAEALLKRLDGSWEPSASERLERARKLTLAGRMEALAELDEAARGPRPVPSGELLREQGQILYKLRRYGEAAEILGRVARASRSPDDEFLAARALSRANRDAEAIQAYRTLVQANPRGVHAEEATYLAARLALLLGRSEEAERAYKGYLKRWKKGKFQKAASYELALAQMAIGHHHKAREAFGALARAADSPVEAAQLRELEGVAALKAGDKAEAVRIFLTVIREQPLSWPALMARERLEQLGLAPSLALEPAPDSAAPPLNVRLPPAIRFLHELGLEDEAEDMLHQEEKRVEAAYPTRGTEALCEAYGQLDQAQHRYRLGLSRIRQELIQKAPTGSNRWAWSCLFPTPYARLVREAEERTQLPPGILHAVMRQESAFDPSARSPALAEGLLQLLPSTAREIARREQVPHEEGTLIRPSVNIDLGARYLAMLRRMWKGNLVLAVASYNAGPQAISRWLAHSPQPEADLWVAHIPYGETRNYVARVLGNWARYAYLAGGEASIPRIPLVMNRDLKVEEGAF
ncbi:MAG: transglycosylase SLT domain-containing protein [Myxococcales bacterium]|nr:transglycosylase SLT domain-containing protein [Polyangiaceae bacterium]MDW8250344.1 transglycosylase SLT domain-containing protein [Myxococcales bacterium]